MSIKPAYHVFLTATQKRLIAEIAAIQSQIEWLMRLTVQHCLEVSPETAREIMGSTSIRANGAVWLKVVKDSFEDSGSIFEWADYAAQGLAKLAEDRNSFLHTLYAHQDGDEAGDFNVEVAHQPLMPLKARQAAAIKVKTNRPVDLSGLREARDRAARLSVIFAHFEWEAMQIEPPSPFQRRLASLRLEPLPSEVARTAKEQKRPPRSSPR